MPSNVARLREQMADRRTRGLPATTAAVSQPSGLTGTAVITEVEDTARDPGDRGRAGGAGLIVFLVSDAAAPVSGATLPPAGAQSRALGYVP